MTDSVFLDTNVLVYAHDHVSPFHYISSIILKCILNKTIRGIVSEQNIIELYRVLTNPMAIQGVKLSEIQVIHLLSQTYFQTPFHIVYPTQSSLTQTMAWAEQYKVRSINIFDLRLAAQVIESNADCFLTFNKKDFSMLSSLIPVLTPEEWFYTRSSISE